MGLENVEILILKTLCTVK